MFFSSWLRNRKSSSRPARPITRSRPQFETLEDRSLPSGVSFSPPVNYPVGSGPLPYGSGPHSVAVADFDGDGNFDLAVANQGHGAGTTISVLLGNGDGTFRGAQDYFVG